MINDFPYTNLHALNLDWVLKVVKQAENLEEEIDEAIETAGAAEATAIAANQTAQQATLLVQEAMSQIGEKADYDYVDQAVRTASDFLSESINAVAAEVDGKVDKRVGGGTEAIMYGQAKDGTERKYTIGVSVTTGNTVPMRDPNGNIYAADPTANQQVATKAYVDTEVGGKLDATKTALTDAGALTTLATAPASARIVGINADNRQFSISLGSGLSLSNSNVLSATGGGGEGGNVPTPEASDNGRALIAGADGTFGWGVKPVAKVSTDNIVYGRIEGAEAALPIATGSPTANTIARRGSNGVLAVGNPTSNNHAATKKYVDDSILTVQPWPIALITLTGPDGWTSTSDWTEITAAVTYGVIKLNAGSNEWYTPFYAINMTSSIKIRCYTGTNFFTYTINSDGTYTTV